MSEGMWQSPGSWREAFGPCPGGCGCDADAYLEDGSPVVWWCHVCHGSFEVQAAEGPGHER